MSNTSAYSKIIDNFTFLKNKESLSVIDQTLDFVNKNNMPFIDGLLYFTDSLVEKKKTNIVNHSVTL